MNCIYFVVIVLSTTQASLQLGKSTRIPTMTTSIMLLILPRNVFPWFPCLWGSWLEFVGVAFWEGGQAAANYVCASSKLTTGSQI